MTDVPDWKHHRVIHSRYPPQNLFDGDDAVKNELLGDLESMTSDRLYRWREFVSPEDYKSGEGWGAVMASFCYSTPGRFNSTTFGAYYCANSHHTALAEWAFHAAKVWRDFRMTDEASAVVRSYVGAFKKPLVDVRRDPKAHNPDSYTYSQAKAQLLKVDGAYGLMYLSVRHPGGVCAALFRPPATTPVKQAAHFSVLWNGEEFTEFAKLSKFESL